MNANEQEYLNDLAERVIGAAYEVSNYIRRGIFGEGLRTSVIG
jgi:hypothetical protein